MRNIIVSDSLCLVSIHYEQDKEVTNNMANFGTGLRMSRIRRCMLKRVIGGIIGIAVYSAFPTSWKSSDIELSYLAVHAGTNTSSHAGIKREDSRAGQIVDEKNTEQEAYFIDHYVMTTFNTEKTVGLDILWLPFLSAPSELTMSDVQIVYEGKIIDSLEQPQYFRTDTTVTHIYIRFTRITGPLQAGTRINFTLTAANGDRIDISHTV